MYCAVEKRSVSTRPKYLYMSKVGYEQSIFYYVIRSVWLNSTKT